jgi:hypothetical protein
MDPAAVSPWRRVPRCSALMIVALVCTRACAVTPDWLPARDQNPFVLGSGVPLPPDVPREGGTWNVSAYAAEANSQIISATPHNAVVFAAETRETRVTASYAFNDEWSVRGSLGDLWVGGGFLNGPIRRFHNLIGASQGLRGRLAVATPFIRFVQNGKVIYQLDRSGQDAAPALADLTRTWSASPRQDYGVSLGVKIPLGSAQHLSDTGGRGVSISAFTDFVLSESIQFGARVGYLHESSNDLLPGLARSGVPFGGIYARARVIGGWNAELQYDAHGALYHDVPNYLSYAGLLSVAVTHPLGTNTQLILNLGEDVPVAHTQDVVLQVALRTAWGER